MREASQHYSNPMSLRRLVSFALVWVLISKIHPRIWDLFSPILGTYVLPVMYLLLYVASALLALLIGLMVSKLLGVAVYGRSCCFSVHIFEEFPALHNYIESLQTIFSRIWSLVTKAHPPMVSKIAQVQGA